MTTRKMLIASFALLASAAAIPAIAQTAPAAAPAATASFAAGAKVSDTAGGEVGTISSVDGDHVILKTDRHEVRLPKTSFTATDAGFIMAMTRAEVNAAVEKTVAESAQLIAVGAVVKDTQGGTVGTIEALDDQFVTLKLASSSVKLPRTAVAATPAGPVVGVTAAELEAQAAGAAASAEAPAAEAPAEDGAE